MNKKRFSNIEKYKDGDTLIYKVVLNPEHLVYVQSLLESYEGIGMMRTKDPSLGNVQFWVQKCSQKIFEQFIASIHDEVEIKSIELSEDREYS